MKIIFSPSKEMRDKNIIDLDLAYKNHKFEEKTKELLAYLQNLSSQEISNLMKIKNKLLEQTFNNIKNFSNLENLPALSMYNGVAYKNIDLASYKKEDFDFMENHLFILSAFYGAVSPLTLLKNYRLDMTMKPEKINLYKFWKDEINIFLSSSLKKDEILLNLASKEFSKILDKKIIKNILDIDFKDFKDGKYKSISSYVKQARGAFLNEIIKNKITSIEEIKKISVNNYIFNEELSSKNSFIFTR
ncbi:MAG: YaaA family protein [Fusobacterium sp.]|nr:YaaA family protein [Fusobacterium sp.]